VNTQPQGNNPPRTRHPHQRFDESRPQPPTTPETIQCDRDPEKPVHDPQDITSSEPGPIPQDPTARLDLSPSPLNVPHPQVGSTSLTARDPGLMVNVPHSEAPSPWNERPGNDE
jgi:hypothetical protein